MRSKSFISVSEHESFYSILEELLARKNNNSQEDIILELRKEKDEFNALFEKYRNSVSEIHFLINRYHSLQTEIRKKIRKVQLTQHPKEKDTLINSVRSNLGIGYKKVS